MLDGYLDNCVIYADTDGNTALSTAAAAVEPSNTSTFADGWMLVLPTANAAAATLRVVPAAPSTYDSNRFATGKADECHDATSMLKLYVSLAAPPLSSVVSPLTTLLVAMQERGYTQAERKVKAAFGINGSTYTLGQTDPIKALYVDLDKGAEPIMRAEQQVMTAVMQTSAYLMKTSADLPIMARVVWAALAQAVEDLFPATAGNKRQLAQVAGTTTNTSAATGGSAAVTPAAPLDLTQPPTLAILLNNALALLAAGGGTGTAWAPNTAGVDDPARRIAALQGMSNTQQIIEAAVSSGNLTQVAAASRVAQENVTQQLRVLAAPGSTPNVAAFMAATSTASLARAVAFATTTVTGPTIPDSLISGSGGSLQAEGVPRGGSASSSWVASNMAGFVILVVLVPVVLIIACGSGYFVYKQRKRASAYNMQMPPMLEAPADAIGVAGEEDGGFAAAVAAAAAAQRKHQSAGGASALSAVTSLGRRVSGASTCDVQFLPCPPTAVAAAAGAINLSRMRTNFNALFEREAPPTLANAAMLPGGSLALATRSHGPPMSREAGTIVASAPTPAPGAAGASTQAASGRATIQQVVTHYANVLFDIVPRAGGNGMSGSDEMRASGDSGRSRDSPASVSGRAAAAAGLPRRPSSFAGSPSGVVAAGRGQGNARGSAVLSDGGVPLTVSATAVLPRPRSGSASALARQAAAGLIATELGVPAADGPTASAAVDSTAVTPAGAGGSNHRLRVRSGSMGRATLDETAAEAVAWQVEGSRGSGASFASIGRPASYGGVPRAPVPPAPSAATSAGGAPTGLTLAALQASFSRAILAAPSPAATSTGGAQRSSGSFTNISALAGGIAVAPSAVARAGGGGPPSPDPEAGLPYEPGLGGGGYLSLATASGRLPTRPLDGTYSPPDEAHVGIVMAPPPPPAGALVARSGPVDGPRGRSAGVSPLAAEKLFNPLFEPIAAYLSPLTRRRGGEGNPRTPGGRSSAPSGADTPAAATPLSPVRNAAAATGVAAATGRSPARAAAGAGAAAASVRSSASAAAAVTSPLPEPRQTGPSKAAGPRSSMRPRWW